MCLRENVFTESTRNRDDRLQDTAPCKGYVFSMKGQLTGLYLDEVTYVTLYDVTGVPSPC